jgi:hypothetical protein
LLSLWVTEGGDTLIYARTLLGIATSLTFYLRVRCVARRIGAHGLGGQALIIAIMAPSLPLAISQVWSVGFLAMSRWSAGRASSDMF